MFEVPTYEVEAVFFTAVGVIVLWGKLGTKRVGVYALSALIKQLGIGGRSAVILEFLVFVTIGIVAAVGVVQPTNVAQAFTAGLGWTGLFTQTPSDQRTPSDGE